MRKFTAPILLALAVLLLSPTEGWSLPPCPGSLSYTWTNCVGTYTYNNGKYVGEYRNGKRTGQGTYTFASGSKYVGEWRNGQEHGQGTYTFANGDKYVGEFRNAKKHGQGTAYYLADNKFKGNKYVGEYRNGKEHGQGTKTYASGSKYVGELRNDTFHGQGTYTYADGTKFVGGWKDSKRHGQGTYTFANGRVLEGIWKDDRFQYAKKAPSPRRAQRRAGSLSPCPGSPTRDTGVAIRWKNCVGTYTHANGDKYVGEWKNKKRHGQGTFTHFTGQKYVGEWKYGKQHGQGTYTFVSGHKYVGAFKDGKENGLGTETHANGSKYVGAFKDGKWHGQGAYFYADGTVKEGIFKNGAFQYAKKAPLPRRARSRLAEKRRRKKEERLARLERALKRKEERLARERRKEKERLARLAREFKRKEARLRKREKEFEKKRRQSRVARRTPSLAPPQRGWDAKGSGIYLKGSTHILTNLHVVRTANKLRISFPSGEKYSGEVIVRDVNNDVAIVELRGMNQKRGGFTVNLNADIDAGMEVYAIGYPLNSGINIVDGIVSSTTGLDRNISKFTMTAPINEGNSGGPVIDENGNLVGIAQSGLVQRGVENVRFGTKISTTVHALKQAKLSRQFSIQVRRRKRKFSSREIFKRYSPYVVRIDVK
ncbi:hypothetical protein [uncultured Mediterranean phage uvDeep-CGR2-AD3-C191]|nr:hypothetical protein [uncultured Mediterranean phage uvDeep-CGR2-AD3-C191]